MTQDLREEFDHYLENISSLPTDFFVSGSSSHYSFLSCIQNTPQKKIFLLQDNNGKKILCKYATSEYEAMLSAEHEAFCIGNFPFLPYLIDYQKTENGSFLLREYIEGRTLAEMIEENGPFTLQDAIIIMRKVCSALISLHSLTPPLIYRDIKPSNIVITDQNELYLVDMGTARRYREGDSSDTLCMGTLDFAAPEQFGARQTDCRTDIYALGILFYYLLTGESKIQEEYLTKLPSKASQLIRKSTAFNPDDRYTNVKQFMQALSHIKPDTNLIKWKSYAIVASAIAFLAVVLLSLFAFPRLFPSQNKEVKFSSALLEQAVREELGKTEDDPIYPEDLNQITQIYICGNQVFHDEKIHDQYYEPHLIDGQFTGQGDISDISILAEMKNLQYLKLDYQQIYDISPLKNLPLVSLSLTGNPVYDLTPLSGCKSLYNLEIANSGVSSLEPISSCTSLTSLDCANSPIGSLAPIKELHITYLSMMEIPASDYEVLEGLPLVRLRCRNTPLTILDYLKNIPTLQSLSLYECGITSLEVFAGFNQLYHLDVCSNSINSLEGIEELTHLKTLAIQCNPLYDGTDFAKLPGLRSLWIQGTNISDFTFLNDIPELTELTVSPSQVRRVKNDVDSPKFMIKISDEF